MTTWDYIGVLAIAFVVGMFAATRCDVDDEVNTATPNPSPVV